MSNFPVKVAERATNFEGIESLAQIKPPYPAQGSAEWWALRKRMEELIARDSRRRGTQYTEAECDRSRRAINCALATADDNGQAQLTYERNGFTREQWLTKWNPKALNGELEFTPAQNIQMLRNTLRGFGE